MVNRYLSLVSLPDAIALVNSFPGVIRSLDIPLEESAGRITASALFARYSVPGVLLAAMDGIAVRSAETAGASEQRPVTLENATRVNTGNVVPPGFDAVVMIEEVFSETGRYVLRKAATPWQHVRPAGEDIAESEMILPPGHRIDPHDIGALAAYGYVTVPVVAPRVGLVPTGSELVPHGSSPLPGQVVESNTVMAASYLSALGAVCTRYPITRDEPDRIRDVISRAVDENEVAIVSAGSAVGTRDYTAEVIGELGEVLVHGVAIKPGRPVIIGKIRGTPVIGMPGYPLSALTVLREIVAPLMARYGLDPPIYKHLSARLAGTIEKEIGTDEFVLAAVGKIGPEWVVSPLSRGAGVQMSAVRSNGILTVPSTTEGFAAGDKVEVRLTVSKDRAASALLVVGSHDPSLDRLAALLSPKKVELHSSHTGSMGGLLALMRKDCHAAPIHLLSPDGSYNAGYLERYLPGEEIVLLCIAGREQGVVSRDGIGIDDLPGRNFVNRQKGSGTRILLDYELSRRGIDPASIPGYDRELTTHTAVALAVKSGDADAGVCVFSSAKAFGLKFVPISTERYELAVRKEHWDDPRIGALFSAVNSEEFREILRSMGGYDTSITGMVREVPGK